MQFQTTVNLQKYFDDKIINQFKVLVLRDPPEEGFWHYVSLIKRIGDFVPIDEDLLTENKTGKDWIDIKYDPQFPKSYRHSSVYQPLHTDGAYESCGPPLVLLYCVCNQTIGGNTIFVDSRDLFGYLENYSADLLDRCMNVPLTFSKGGDFKKKTIIEKVDNDYKLAWNYFRVDTSDSEAIRLRDDFREFLEQKIIMGGLCSSVNLRAGDAVLFHDSYLLHGRHSFIAKHIGCRHLMKVGICPTSI